MKNRVSKSVVTRVSIEPMSRDADEAANARFSREFRGKVSTAFVNLALSEKSHLPMSMSDLTHDDLVAYVKELAGSKEPRR